jgi:DNA-binding transcriptional regulator YiaG
MSVKTMTPEEHERELLASLRSHRKLPPPAERKRIRERAGVSLRSLAAAIGCSHVAITRWETGAKPADPAQLIRYQRLLDEFARLEAARPTRNWRYDAKTRSGPVTAGREEAA